VWAPRAGDPRRKTGPPKDYPWRAVEVESDGKKVVIAEYPKVGLNQFVGVPGRYFGWNVEERNLTFNPCAQKDRASDEPYQGGKRPPPNPPRRVPKPGDSRKVPIATPSPQQPIGTKTASNKRLKV
jgi:hypothetical protein